LPNATYPRPLTPQEHAASRWAVASRANVPPFHVMDLLEAVTRQAIDQR